MGHDAPELWNSPSGPALHRRFVVERWDTAWVAGGSESDSTILHPYGIQAGSAGVYVFDVGTQRLVAFDRDGRLRWSFGREGAGPEEFRNVRDVKLGFDGLLYLLDPQNDRVMVLDSLARVRRRIRLDRVGHAEQLAPLADGRLMLVTMTPDTPLVILDREGRPAGNAEIPWRGFTRLHPLVRQGLTAVAPDGGEWVYGFMLGDGWFAFRGTQPLPFIGRYADHRPFPQVVEEDVGGGHSVGFAEYVPCTGCDVAMADSSVYVLAGGSSESARSVVDRFRRRDGSYVESFRLPGPTRRIAIRDGTVFAVVDEPLPAVLALRPGRPHSQRSSSGGYGSHGVAVDGR